MSNFHHIPVLYEATLDGLAIRSGGVYIDGTLGGGGHTAGMLERGASRVLGIDQDPAALAAAGERLNEYRDRLVLAHGNFRDIATIAKAHGFENVDGVLLDIGVSSHQLDAGERGFSFAYDAPLDMRMNPTQGVTAAELVNTLPEEQLADLIFQYGEERASRRIARRIVERRKTASLTSTAELADVVLRAMGGRKDERIHPATRTFQALRIAVNDELGALEEALPAATELLRVDNASAVQKGRLAVITFHSLEDRIVKEFMRRESAICLLPPRLFAEQCPHLIAHNVGPRPCIYIASHDCDYIPRLAPVTNKPITAADEEVKLNPRSRSAKLRVAERIAAEPR